MLLLFMIKSLAYRANGVGAALGEYVGDSEGDSVGLSLGDSVGENDGDLDGCLEGVSVGKSVGGHDGSTQLTRPAWLQAPMFTSNLRLPLQTSRLVLRPSLHT